MDVHDRFTSWYRWRDRNEIAGIKLPGVYVVAVFDSSLAGQPFSWIPEVMYVGMTNSAAGLKGRLKQFDITIAGKRGHGGADRARYEYRDYPSLVDRLYVAAAVFDCDVNTNSPTDLRVMGAVASFEYECLAQYVERFGQLPKFNDKNASPKYSLTVGRGVEPK